MEEQYSRELKLEQEDFITIAKLSLDNSISCETAELMMTFLGRLMNESDCSDIIAKNLASTDLTVRGVVTNLGILEKRMCWES